MKKLLFIAALMMLGANAFAEQPTGSVSVPVEVKAKITDDTFSITDINGAPLVLDFKSVAKKAAPEVWTAKEEYKITSGEAIDAQDGVKFTMKLGADTVDLKLTNQEAYKQDKGKSTLIAHIGLDAEEKTMVKDAKVVTGAILGSITEDITQKNTGDYLGDTTLTATVTP